MAVTPKQPSTAMSAEIKIICFFMKVTVYSTGFYLTDAGNSGVIKYVAILITAGITGELLERAIIESEKRYKAEKVNRVLNAIVAFINKLRIVKHKIL